MDAEMHVDELAELYALGALDDSERDTVDKHIASCTQCLRRVGEAEETMLALERGTHAAVGFRAGRKTLPFARRRAMSWWAAPAIAAAFIVGLLVPRPLAPPNPATLAMIGSHFSHAQFAGPPGAPAAKVIYARDRSWYYVLVVGSRRFEVYGVQSGRSTLLGTTTSNGSTSELFVRSAPRFDRIELRSAREAIETAVVR